MGPKEGAPVEGGLVGLVEGVYVGELDGQTDGSWTVLGSQHCMFCLAECYYIGLTEALELIRQIPRFSIESINFYSALVSFCI